MGDCIPLIRVTAMPADTNPYGGEISVYAAIEKQGRSSMTIAVTAEARERDGDTIFDVAKGQFIFVALDDNDRPRPIAAEEPNG